MTIPSAPVSAPAAAPAPAGLRLSGISRSYGSTHAVKEVDLLIPAGSLTVIVGPSGSGKSTLLRLIAGLEHPTSGHLTLGDAPISRGSGKPHDIGMVFQDYALFPHMTVRENLSFGLRLEARHSRGAGPGREQIEQRVNKVAAMFALTPYLDRRPDQLSGGQRQRVALGRAIIRRPSVLLLDEPLSALDPQLRVSARAEIVRLQREIGCTLVMVTHDQHEALTMATNLVVMRDGSVVQSGSVEELFNRPTNQFVAEFIGSPAMNIHLLDDGAIGWRPTDGRIVDATDDPHNTDDFVVTGTVELTSFTGDARELLCTDGTVPFTVVDRSETRRLRQGDPIRVHVKTNRLHHFDQEGQSR